MSITNDGATALAPETLDRLLTLRRSLLDERRAAPTPAIERALEMADYYVFLALGYAGYTNEMFPEEA
jgi:hypothetical protein